MESLIMLLLYCGILSNAQSEVGTLNNNAIFVGLEWS